MHCSYANLKRAAIIRPFIGLVGIIFLSAEENRGAREGFCGENRGKITFLILLSRNLLHQVPFALGLIKRSG